MILFSHLTLSFTCFVFFRNEADGIPLSHRSVSFKSDEVRCIFCVCNLLICMNLQLVRAKDEMMKGSTAM